MIDTKEILRPKSPPQLSNYDILYGAPISPIKKLEIMNEDEFEDLILEWVSGYLNDNYVSVRKCGGAGDKGRDIIAVVDSANNIWDNYQCKHYDKKLTPTDFYLELGKLCYYSHNGDFSIPKNYYIITSKGIGSKLGDLLDNPNDLKQKLIENWSAYVENKITTTPIPLIDDLNSYVSNFDFSIIKDIPAHEFLAQFEKTKWYSYRFGGIKKQREALSVPDFSKDEMKLRYIVQLLAVYSEEISTELNSVEELAAYGKCKVHFDIQRNCFYSVETLKEFERDNLPPGSRAFDNFKEEVLTLIYPKIFGIYRNAFEKVNEILCLCSNMDTNSNPLTISINLFDKHGMCHHLVNENKLTWIEK